MLLRVQDLRVNYGPVCAVSQLSFHVAEGELVCLLGANGAGKTSSLRALMGVQKISGGQVHWLGQSLNHMDSTARVRQGLVLVPEGRGIFGNLSIEENLELALWLRGGAWKSEWQNEQEQIWGLFPRLRERRRQLAFSLSGGEQQMLAIARALLLKPRLLMLDEPSMGLAPKIVGEVFNLLGHLKEKGVSILLVEQNAKAALQIADRAYVMEQGRVTQEGAAQDLLRDTRVIQSYLGGA